ncbi:hypothetical protein [Albibacterium bauzanense]|nr:hypothetical protein [Albibacterium bauzanense]
MNIKQLFGSAMKIKLYVRYSLVFIALLVLFACNQENKASDIHLIWDQQRPVALSISKNLIEDEIDPSKSDLQVRLVEDNNSVSILGNYKYNDDDIVFEPVIPFSRGLHYEVFYKDKSIGIVEVPLADISEASILEEIYPTADTLPENVLKIYLQFSKPMRTGESEKYIAIIKNEKDTVSGVFLNLDPELWNEDRTVLTVWLDPGRIKRDLIPNLTLGAPLVNHTKYSIVVSENWLNAQGLKLKESFVKTFFVSERDSLSPDIIDWALELPRSGSKDPLKVYLKESLDYFLLNETIQVLDEKNKVLPVKINVRDKERYVDFIPLNNWTAGQYKIQVQSRLEDLAGNNLNRPFDRDLTKENKLNPDKFQDILFVIE